jgi:hypothetical protein
VALTASLMVAIPGVANAETSVSGKLPDGFVFTKAGSPYRITNTLLVDEGVSVRVEPGVTLIAPKGKPIFWSLGNIDLDGSEAEKIRVIGGAENNRGSFVKVTNAPRGSKIRISHTLLDSVGKLIEDTPATNDSLDIVISDSDLLKTTVYAWYPRSLSVERNVFLDRSGISLGYSTDEGGPAIIRNNLFTGIPGVDAWYGNTPNKFWISVWASYGGAINVSGNTFVPSKYIFLNSSVDGIIDASENFWGTTDPLQIQKYVLDKADSFQWKNFVIVDRPLSFPEALTPEKARLVKNEVKPLKLTKFAKGSTKLSSKQVGQIRDFATTITVGSQINCTTTYTSAKDKSLALRQANSACSRLKSESKVRLTTKGFAKKSSNKSLNMVVTMSLSK